jgi:hypothetical protein
MLDASTQMDVVPTDRVGDLDGSGPVEGREAEGDSGASVTVAGGADGTKPWFSLHLQGQGFAAFDGLTVRARVRSSADAGQRQGLAVDRIVAGAFSMTFPEVLEHNMYKTIDVYIDANGDGACEQTTDFVWETIVTTASEDLEVPVTTTAPPGLPLDRVCEAFQ